MAIFSQRDTRTLYSPDFDDQRSLIDMDSLSDLSSAGSVSIFVVFVFILETLVVVFLAVLEYFLRFTSVFPVKHLNFSCTDPSIGYYTSRDLTFPDFAYKGQIPDEVIIVCSFCVPVILIIIAELSLWGVSDEHQKTIRVLCRCCKCPQVVRRIIRYIGAFLFGMLITLVFTDVLKMMTGRLRPNFLEVCRPNMTQCVSGDFNDEDVCQEKDQSKIREARLSFPSLQSSMTAYAAVFLAIYLHAVIHSHAIRVMRPFLTLIFIMLALLCGTVRYGLHYNHWTDVVVGLVLGMVIAWYLCVYVMHNFRERQAKGPNAKLKSYIHQQIAFELRDMYKEDKLDRLSYFGGPGYPASQTESYSYSGNITIPRPHAKYTYQLNANQSNGHVNESNTDDIREHYHRDNTHRDNTHRDNIHRENYDLDQETKMRQQNTFQRDLQRTLDQYRRGSDDGYNIHM